MAGGMSAVTRDAVSHARARVARHWRLPPPRRARHLCAAGQRVEKAPRRAPPGVPAACVRARVLCLYCTVLYMLCNDRLRALHTCAAGTAATTFGREQLPRTRAAAQLRTVDRQRFVPAEWASDGLEPYSTVGSGV